MKGVSPDADMLALDAGGEQGLTVVGVVEPGDRRGRTLGFPTANIAIDDRTFFDDGVYFGRVRRPSGEDVAAAVSVGRRVTFHSEGSVRLLEAHLLDFDADMYGETLYVRLVFKLRDQVKFASISALISQLTTDVGQCRRLAGRPAEQM